MTNAIDITPASTARASLRAMVIGAISRDCSRLHLFSDGIVIEESKNGFDPILYPEAHTTFNNSSVLRACGLTFDDLVRVIATGAGIECEGLPGGYLTWESSLGELGDATGMADCPVNWFFRPASRSAPAALIAGIANRAAAAPQAPARAMPQAA